jgi:hypothetical protein
MNFTISAILLVSSFSGPKRVHGSEASHKLRLLKCISMRSLVRANDWLLNAYFTESGEPAYELFLFRDVDDNFKELNQVDYASEYNNPKKDTCVLKASLHQSKRCYSELFSAFLELFMTA